MAFRKERARIPLGPLTEGMSASPSKSTPRLIPILTAEEVGRIETEDDLRAILEEKAKRDYTFILGPGEKKRYYAGDYNPETLEPRYELKMAAPASVRHSISALQSVIQRKEGHEWIWDFDNQSPAPAIVAISKDGVILPDKE